MTAGVKGFCSFSSPGKQSIYILRIPKKYYKATICAVSISNVTVTFPIFETNYSIDDFKLFRTQV